jgi:hypothetical protein
LSAAQPNRTDEALVIDAQGGVWFWLLAGATPERRDRCGTFVVGADPQTAAEAQRIATTLGKLAPVTEALPRGNVGLMIEAGGRKHQLAAFGTAERSPELKEALQLIDQLRDQALTQPRSAIQIALRTQAPASIIFEVTSIGSEPITLQFDPESFALFGFDQADANFTWRSLEGDSIGLLDATSLELLDGVLVPANLPPNRRAVAAFNDVLNANPGSYTLTGSVNGQLLLLRPDQPPAPMPNRKFDLTTAQIPWTAH